MDNTMTTSKQKLVSTDGYQYFGVGLNDEQKTLSVNYLENTISIGIFNLLPVSQQTERSKYDYKNGTCIYLKGKQAKMLYRFINKAIDAIENGKEIEDCAVPSGGNLIEVTNGRKYGMNDGIVLAIFTKINSDKTANDPAVFSFKNDNYVKSYDHKTGKYESGYIDSDIDFFLEQLHKFAKESVNASAHFVKKSMQYTLGSFINRQLQMNDRLGISSTNARSYSSQSKIESIGDDLSDLDI